MLPVKIGEAGRLQPYFLYEDWEFAHLLGINEQTIKQTGGGINYYIHGQNVRLTAEYLDTEFGTATAVHRRPRRPRDRRADRQGEGLQHVPPHAAGRRVLER